MWRVTNPTIKPTTFDFSSSGQANQQVSQLFAEDVMLINAIELVDWDMEQAQLMICKSCGMVGCKPGDWVSLRSAGEMILILPAFALWFEEGQIDTEYRPPSYVAERGIPYFTLADYEALRALHSAFPAVEKIRQLRLNEAIWAFQLEAPNRAFGHPPKKVVARKDAIMGASEGDLGEQVRLIEAFAQENRDNESPVRLRLPATTETVVSLFLNVHEFIEWRVLAYDGADRYLMLNSEFVISPEE
jgi:hypothetical protein